MKNIDSNPELKPCPFCTSNDVNYHNGWAFGDRNRDRDDKDGRSPSITCEDCGIGMTPGWMGRGLSDRKAMELTVDKWNTRPMTTWDDLVEKYDKDIGKKIVDDNNEVYTFFGLVHSDDDYYYGLVDKKGRVLLHSCVGSLEMDYSPLYTTGD